MNFSENPYFGVFRDKAFKYLFSKPKYAEDIINSYYEYIGDERLVSVIKDEPQKTYLPDYYLGKTCYSDIYLTLDNGEVFIIEMYTNNFTDEEYSKSIAYMHKSYIEQLKEGNKYKIVKNITCLNFINHNFAKVSDGFVNEFKQTNKDTLLSIKNERENFVLVRIDKMKTLSYNKDISRFEKWCLLIKAKSLEEIEKLKEGDEIMELVYQDIKNYKSDFLSRCEYENYIYERNRNIESGISQGISQNKIEVAKNMLDKNKYSDEEIISISGVTINELNKLKKRVL